MNRKTKAALGAGAIGLLLLLFSTGAKAQEPDELDPDDGDNGWGKLDPDAPPEDRRTTPKTPGASKRRPQPLGNRIIPNLPMPGGDCTLAGGTFNSAYADGDMTDEIRDAATGGAIFGLPELAQGTLQVFLPELGQVTREAVEESIKEWACVFGYEAVVFVEETPENRAWTAAAWYRGNQLGVYDLEQTYTRSYLETAMRADALPEMFTFGLVDWLHGPV